MAIKPVGHRLLVEVPEVNLKTDWGFEIQTDKRLEDAAQIKGTLVAIGDQCWKAFGPEFTGEPWAKIGDEVLYAEYAGRRVLDPETGKEYRLMNDEDITAVITVTDGEKVDG